MSHGVLKEWQACGLYHPSFRVLSLQELKGLPLLIRFVQTMSSKIQHLHCELRVEVLGHPNFGAL